ncbi:MAG: hypothetical protein LAO06_20195 [Acidobacteriia bacterium]|nr:hypothetical protein [Terriglobia bacterium]
MHHFVQYHNPQKRGGYRPGGFGMVTDKPVDSIIGDRIWRVTKAGRPQRYCLCESFVVEQVGSASNDSKLHRAWAKTGLSFVPPTPIDSEVWFKKLLRAAGNFGFGLQRIKDVQVVSGLMRILNDQQSRLAPANREFHL